MAHSDFSLAFSGVTPHAEVKAKHALPRSIQDTQGPLSSGGHFCTCFDLTLGACCWPSCPSVHLHLLWPSRTSDQKQPAWDTLDTFPSKTVLYPTYFSPLAPPHSLSLPRQGQLLLVPRIAGDEWWLLGLFFRCKWQAACSPCPHSPGSSQAAEAIAGVSFQRACEARWHSQCIQWDPVGVGVLRV